MTEYTDTERLDFLAESLRHKKWADTLPMFRPRNVLGRPTEKYIENDPQQFRAAIDYCMRYGLNLNY